MTTPEISNEGGSPGPEWNDYVLGHPHGRFFHCAEWARVYAELPWLEPCFLAARVNGTLCGVMPLALVRLPVLGTALVSAPYCVEAGALTDTPAHKHALEAAALALAHRRGARFLEVRQSDAARTDWPHDQSFATYARALAARDEDNLAAIPRKQRAMVRKGAAAGLSAGASDDRELFYAMHAAAMHALGTPVYDRRLFAALWRHLGASSSLFAVRHAGTVVAMVMSFWFKDRVMPYYAGALPQARALKAYDFLYWQLMCTARARGVHTFDFGRSLVGSGAGAFKRNWGFVPRLLDYQTVAVTGGAPPLLDPEAPFNRLARRAWSYLPRALANRLGPYVARRLY